MTDDKILDKVRKLMALAEKAGTKHEAELAFQRAQEMMSKYAIDEATLALKTLGRDVEIVSETITVGTDKSCQILFTVVVNNNNCACIWIREPNWAAKRLQEKIEKVTIFGAKSDIEFVKMLYASLLMFCTNNLRMIREIAPERYGGKTFGYNFRLGFATGVGAKLRMARDTAQQEASTGMELVLVSRKDRAHGKLNAVFTEQKARAVARTTDTIAYQKGVKLGSQANVLGGRNSIGN